MTMIETKERSILFSGAMVRAILEGRKTMTRRVVKPTQSMPKVAPLRMEPWIVKGDEQETDDDGLPCWAGFHPDYPGEAKWFSCPYGGVGDRLWVRETHARVWYNAADGWQTIYRADTGNDGPMDGSADGESQHWKPSIFMPRSLSRITLEVASVRVERVQEISEADAKAEGADQEFRTVLMSPSGCKDYHIPLSYRGGFANLWDEINGKRGFGWAVNPWVWVVEFRRLS
jgi:hypothetical protein